MEKAEVRKLAQKYNLPVAEKKDSQGICFIGDISMEVFLSHYFSEKPGLRHADPRYAVGFVEARAGYGLAKAGRVFNTDGIVIGRHHGLIHYTIGERHGFEITKKNSDSGPFYIVAKDNKTNALIVSDKEAEILDFSPQNILLKDVNWINEPEGEELTARIRYRGEKIPCKLGIHNPSTALRARKLSVEFNEPIRGLSLGQSIVFYLGEECLGGAVMDKILG